MVKRTIVATMTGVLTGVICWHLASSGNQQFALPVVLFIISSRALAGFAIGISRIQLVWWLHGGIMGIIFSLPMALNCLMIPTPEKMMIFWSTIIMGLIYGVIIELFTTVIFKASNKE